VRRAGHAAVAALLVSALWAAAAGPARVQALAYGLRQDLQRAILLRSFAGEATLESAHFVVHYHAPDSEWAPLVLECAEDARQAVLERLGCSLLTTSPDAGPEKVALLLYPTQESLQRQFGPDANFMALGAYWCGVVQILSPRVWVEAEPTPGGRRAFWVNGPLVHEYTHYVLDKVVPGGRYPRWFSEGLAQYMEYKEAGYLWLEPSNAIYRRPRDGASSTGSSGNGSGNADAGSGPGWAETAPPRLSAPQGPEGRLHGLGRLAENFDNLDNVALAYREAFLLTTYMYEDLVGAGGMNQFLTLMADGESFETALKTLTGKSMAQFEESWLRWLDRSLERYS